MRVSVGRMVGLGMLRSFAMADLHYQLHYLWAEVQYHPACLQASALPVLQAPP